MPQLGGNVCGLNIMLGRQVADFDQVLIAHVVLGPVFVATLGWAFW